MNKVEAKAVLAEEITRYRRRSYEELLALRDQCEHFERVSPSGTTYQIQMEAFYDDESKRTLRVLGLIDDGGVWSFFKSMSDDFIIAPDGTFIGE